MKLGSSILLTATVVASTTEVSALSQNVFSRKAFVTRVVTAGSVATFGVMSSPHSASAREGALSRALNKAPTSSSSSPDGGPDANTKAGSKELFRGGKNMSDALHNGTDLDKGQAEVAGSLLSKMGLVDITPDKGGSSSRAPPTIR
jgi:hypothetical protein